ncbi:MAG: hypothetical protein Q8M92_01315, partial [Candidatus Subteraquimicrobiales bacterium]|nr:hypothetical protein [Candidatus Subteraquimicrobiales bacterium]
MGIKKLSIILLIVVSLITLSFSFPAYAASDFTFNGFGSGHGVGICMAGAEEMARQGYTHRDILRKYYSGIAFSEIAEPQTIKVGLYSSTSSISISANGSFFAYENDPNGAKYIGAGTSGQIFSVSYSTSSALTYTVKCPDGSTAVCSYSIRFVPSGSNLILVENGFNYPGLIEAKYSANSLKLWA